MGADLHTVRKLLDADDSMSIPRREARICVVLHGDAGYWLLKDEACRAQTGADKANPNKKTVRELVDSGASPELCANTLESHGWEKRDLLPGVNVGVGAYPRIIDLQLLGRAYVWL